MMIGSIHSGSNQSVEPCVYSGESPKRRKLQRVNPCQQHPSVCNQISAGLQPKLRLTKRILRNPSFEQANQSIRKKFKIDFFFRGSIRDAYSSTKIHEIKSYTQIIMNSFSYAQQLLCSFYKWINVHYAGAYVHVNSEFLYASFFR